MGEKGARSFSSLSSTPLPWPCLLFCSPQARLFARSLTRSHCAWKGMTASEDDVFSLSLRNRERATTELQCPVTTAVLNPPSLH